MSLSSCRACGHARPENVVASYACPACGERNPYASRQHNWRDSPASPLFVTCSICLLTVVRNEVAVQPPCMPRNMTHTRENF